MPNWVLKVQPMTMPMAATEMHDRRIEDEAVRVPAPDGLVDRVRHDEGEGRHAGGGEDREVQGIAEGLPPDLVDEQGLVVLEADEGMALGEDGPVVQAHPERPDRSAPP